MALKTVGFRLQTIPNRLQRIAPTTNTEGRTPGQRTKYEGVYYDARWRELRKLHLDKFPLCVMCEEKGKVVAGNVVDHIIPHKGDPILFWDQRNWQTLCTPCHDGPKRMMERTGKLAAPVHRVRTAA